MTTDERRSNRQPGTDEHLDPAQDAAGGEAAPSPEQRNAPAPDTGEDVRNAGPASMGEADRAAAGQD